MKNMIFILTALLMSTGVYASEFANISAKDVRNTQSNIDVTNVQPSIVIEGAAKENITDSNLNLLAQTGGMRLFSAADTSEKFDAFVQKWTPILKQNGFAVKEVKFAEDARFGYIEYTSKDGSAIRDFLAEKLNYDAKNIAEINALKDQLATALQEKHMKVIAVMDINSKLFRKTFKLYYITKYNANQEREVQLRTLELGYPDEKDLIKDKTTILRTDREDSLLILGRRINYKWKLGTSEENVLAKEAEYKKYLKENGYEFIDSKVRKLEEVITIGDLKYTHISDIYFFL